MASDQWRSIEGTWGGDHDVRARMAKYNCIEIGRRFEAVDGAAGVVRAQDCFAIPFKGLHVNCHEDCCSVPALQTVVAYDYDRTTDTMHLRAPGIDIQLHPGQLCGSGTCSLSLSLLDQHTC